MYKKGPSCLNLIFQEKFQIKNHSEKTLEMSVYEHLSRLRVTANNEVAARCLSDELRASLNLSSVLNLIKFKFILIKNFQNIWKFRALILDKLLKACFLFDIIR